MKKQHPLNIKPALLAAYSEREKAEISDQWQTKTMNRIRRLGPLGKKTAYWLNLEQLVWRMAPLTCVLIFIFGVVLFNMDSDLKYEMSALFMEDPIEYAWAYSIGR